MCGIFTILSFKDKINQTSFFNGLNSLSHRGPDESGHWISNDHKIALGHRRLSIIDLKTGQQPLSKNFLHLIVNGEFYQYQEIRKDLIKKGHSFKTQSDSEIALHLFEEQGIDCLKNLRGEFAFCLWNENNQSLTAVRDRFGIKPLYYAQYNNNLYISSEIKAFFAAGVPAIWNEEAYYHRTFALQTGTLFKNIYQVPPGHYLITNQNKFQIKRYWDFDYTSSNTIHDEQQAIQLIHDKIKESIDLRLQADTPVACYLSGGIDSCSILGVASQINQHPINAYSIIFNEPAFSELENAENMAKSCQAHFNPITVSDDLMADHFIASIYHSEQPSFNSHSIAKYLLSKKVHEDGFKVVLSGEGSDEIFAGYASYRDDYVLFQNNTSALESAKKILLQQIQSTLIEQNPSRETIKSSLGFIPKWMQAQMLFYDQLSLLFKSDHQASDPYLAFINANLTPMIRSADPIHQSMYLTSKSTLPNYILTALGDRMEMAHSIEARLPYMDHQLVELVSKLSPTLKINGGIDKHILRKAMQPYVTDQVLKGAKKAFTAPSFITNQSGKMFQLMTDLIFSEPLKQLPFFDSKNIHALFEVTKNLAPSEQISLEPIFMEIMSLTAIQQVFNPSH